MLKMEVSERISQLLEYLNVKTPEFAKKLGYKRPQSLYDMIKSKAKPSYDFFNKLLNSEYSELINIEWLITGKGEIEKKKQEFISKESQREEKNDLVKECKECLLFQKEIKIRKEGNERLKDEIERLKEDINYLKGEIRFLKELCGKQEEKENILVNSLNDIIKEKNTIIEMLQKKTLKSENSINEVV